MWILKSETRPHATDTVEDVRSTNTYQHFCEGYWKHPSQLPDHSQLLSPALAPSRTCTSTQLPHRHGSQENWSGKHKWHKPPQQLDSTVLRSLGICLRWSQKLHNTLFKWTVWRMDLLNGYFLFMQYKHRIEESNTIQGQSRETIHASVTFPKCPLDFPGSNSSNYSKCLF